MRVELRDGQWAELRDPERLTNRQRRPLMVAVAKAQPKPTMSGVPVADDEAVLDVNEALVSVFVEKWSFPFPVPAEDPESWGNLPALTADQLAVECMKLMGRAVLDTSEPGTDPTTPSS